MKFSFLQVKKIFCILHGHVFVMFTCSGFDIFISWENKQFCCYIPTFFFCSDKAIFGLNCEFKTIYDGVEAKTRKSQASFQIIQVSSAALPRMRRE